MSDKNQDRQSSESVAPTATAEVPEMSRRGMLAGTAGLGLVTTYDPREAPNNVATERSNAPIDIGSRLELFVDDHLIESMDGVEQRLNPPQPQEIVIEHDEPWEGGGTGYHTVFKDGDTYKMYYKSWQIGIGIPDSGHRLVTGYAESEDGINWEKPNLGLYEFEGSTDNNIVWDGEGDATAGSHNFTPFKDPNPDAAPDARYKAIGGIPPMAYRSADGVHWEKIQEEPVLSAGKGAYDSQNLVFWDPVDEEYRAYFRDFTDDGQRIIETAHSEDFLNWSDETALAYPDAPDEQLYINAIKPYYRAPHIKLGFPARYVERDWDSQSMRELPGWDFRQRRADASLRYGAAVTDTLFMSSRGDEVFRRWPRAFIRPGLWDDDSHSSWKYGDNYTAWQVVETESPVPDKPRELSLYATERYWTSDARLRRYSLRLDGFVSMQAPLSGGEFVTRPVRFEGEDLALNFSTSAGGSLRLELQNPGGQPYQGFSLADSPELFGDDLQRVVEWPNGADVADLEGRPVRLRFVLSDADLYSFQFGSFETSDPERTPTCRDPIHESHDPGLVGHYALDALGDDRSVIDSSGYTHHGTNSGASPIDAGQVDGAYEFDGTSYVNVGYPLLLGSTESATVAGWFETTVSDEFMGIFGHRPGLDIDTGGLTFRTNSTSGSVELFVNGFDDGSNPMLEHSFAYDDGSWHHLAATYDGQTVRLFVDGTEVDTASYAEPLAPDCPSFEIGRYQWVDQPGDVYHFDGSVDDVRVYNEALSASDIQSLASME